MKPGHVPGFFILVRIHGEYLFTDGGRTNNNLFFANNAFRERNYIVRIGLNYRFTWFAPAPVAAR